jgi:hypothetical protein
MKNLIATVIVLTSIAFTSCKKEELPAPASNPNSQINVEYKIESESGHFTCEYSVPEGNTFVTKQYQINRTQNSYTFSCNNGNLLSVKAYNTIPSGKSVKVTILVNGTPFKFSEANAPGAVAYAEGRY